MRVEAKGAQVREFLDSICAIFAGRRGGSREGLARVTKREVVASCQGVDIWLSTLFGIVLQGSEDLDCRKDGLSACATWREVKLGGIWFHVLGSTVRFVLGWWGGGARLEGGKVEASRKLRTKKCFRVLLFRKGHSYHR